MMRRLVHLRQAGYWGMLFLLLVSLVVVALPQKAAAAGESYLWQRASSNGQTINQVIGTGGEFTKFNPQFVQFEQEGTTTTYRNNRIVTMIPNCGTANQPRYVLTITAANTATIQTELPGCGPSLSGTITISGEAPEGSTGAPVQNDVNDDWCTSSGEGNELSYFVCPTINFLAGAITKLDCAILASIKLNTVDLFNTGGTQPASPECALPIGNTPNDNSQKSSDAYKTVWAAFRSIALIILIILGLIMVASQIMGLEIFDAYTVRKMLPRLIIATIFMTLSWDIMKFLYLAANASADAVMDIIKIPFQNIDYTTGGVSAGEVLLTNPISAILLSAATAGAGIIALALFGSIGVVFALLASLLLAVFSAWVLLVVRDVVATLLVLVAPVAIICAAYEPFEKVFKFWKTFLIALLISIPAVALVLAVSQGSALIAVINKHEVVAVVILIGGFALFWGILMQLDKASAFVGNAFSKVTGRAQKALSDYRGNTYKRNYELWKRGALGNFMGRKTRNLGVAFGTAQETVRTTGTGGLRSFKKARAEIGRQGVDFAAAEEMRKRDANRFAGFDEINEEAHRLGVGDNKTRKAQLATALINRAQLSGRKMTQTEADNLVAQYEQSFGGKVGDVQFTIAAVQSAAASSTAHREEKWRTADEATQALRDGLKQLVDNKSITLTQAAAIMTSNKARLDIAGAGFAATMDYIGGNKTLEQFKDSFVTGNGAYQLYGQRWETARAAAQHMKSQLNDLLKVQVMPESEDKNNLIKSLQSRGLMKDRAGKDLNIDQSITRLLAEIDSGYQVAKNLAPLNAQYLSDILGSYQPGVVFKDTPKDQNGQPIKETVFQMIARKKSSDAEMQKYGYEYLQQQGARGGFVDPKLIHPQDPTGGQPGQPGMPG